MQVRPAHREDLPAILAIYNHAVAHTTATYDYEPRTLAQREVWFEDHLRADLPVFVAVEEKGNVVGWSALNRYHERPGYRFTVENSIYIAETHRGRGIGGLLLGPLIPAAKVRGFHVIIAAIDAENQASIRLHARHGFEAVGHFRQVGFKFDRWLDVVYMQRIV